MELIYICFEMDNEELSKLRQIAFEVTIDPNNSLHAASAEDVIKVLSAYIASFKSYLEIKLQSENRSDEDVKDVVKNTKLLVVDTDFNSYHSSLAAYNPSVPATIAVFDKYKTDILDADMDNYSDMLRLRNSYTKEELNAIYNPIFLALSNNYSLKVKANNGIERKVKKPKKEFATYFKPIKTKVKTEDTDKIFQIFVQSPDLKNISTKDIIYSSELLHETYPYTLDRIFYNNKQIFLHDTITCDVEYIDGLYFISYNDLKIEAWGESRKEAENAFDFTFYSLVLNFAEEEDVKLTHDAIVLKDKLNTMIRLIR